jgi:hypothetical protein
MTAGYGVQTTIAAARSARRPAAIDGQRRIGDRACGITAEERGQPTDFGRRHELPGRLRLSQELALDLLSLPLPHEIHSV